MCVCRVSWYLRSIQNTDSTCESFCFDMNTVWCREYCIFILFRFTAKWFTDHWSNVTCAILN